MIEDKERNNHRGHPPRADKLMSAPPVRMGIVCTPFVVMGNWGLWGRRELSCLQQDSGGINASPTMYCNGW